MEKNNKLWRGHDASMNVCVFNYGFVYRNNGNEYECYASLGFDEDDRTLLFAPFSISKSDIDEYFEYDGNEISEMCGVTPDEMDYDWKLEALLKYYGVEEFLDPYYRIVSVNELIDYIIKDDWN